MERRQVGEPESGGFPPRAPRVGETVRVHVASPLHRHPYECAVLEVQGIAVHLSAPVAHGRLVFLPAGVGVTLLSSGGGPQYAGRVAARRGGPDRRLIVELLPLLETPRRPPYPKVVLLSGKGGVGKSLLALNLGTAMQRLGRQAVVVDADLGTPNLHVLLALTPRYSLLDVAAGRCPASSALLPGPEGLRLLPGRTWRELAAGLQEGELDRLLRLLEEVGGESDCLLLDTASGIDRKATLFARRASYLVLVTTPEPAAVADSLTLLRVLAEEGKPLPRAGIVVNMVTQRDQAESILRKVEYAAGRLLGVRVEQLGVVPFDGAVAQAARQQRSLFELGARRPAASAILALARRLVSRFEPGEP